jgi:hypothetical protein
MHKRLIVAAAAIVALPLTAAAHHGWGWTQERESRLAGTIQSISFGNPHMHLQVRDAEGAVWEVDLSPPIVGRASGFSAAHARAGDRVSMTGHRARDMQVRGFKGETITVRGRTFDVYPQREKTLSGA